MGKKENLGEYWPVNLTLIPEKVMEWVILEVISKHAEEQVIRHSQHRYKLFLTNLSLM